MKRRYWNHPLPEKGILTWFARFTYTGNLRINLLTCHIFICFP